MSCAHFMGKVDSELTHYLYEISLNGMEDDLITTESLASNWSLLRGNFPPSSDDIQELQEIAAELDPDAIQDLSTMAGAILEFHESGYITSDIYTTEEDLNHAWNELLRAWTLNLCDECGQEAEEYGESMPIVHNPDCSQNDEEDDD